VRANEDLRAAVSELLRLDVPWLPCADGEGRLQGLVSLASISRHLAGETAPAIAANSGVAMNEVRHALHS
jgi:hypothetical protein